MKEEKSCPYVRLGSNTPNSNCPRLNRNMAGIIPMNRKTEIGFGIASAVYLLISILAVICQSYSITNRTVSNKIANICSVCGPVFKTFISIITKYELITIFEA